MKFLRKYSIEIALVVVLVLAVGFFGYLGYGLLLPSLSGEEFSGERALEYATKQLSFGERVTGTEGNVRMGDWLVEELRKLGWDIVIQPFVIANGESARNIIAIRNSRQSNAPAAILGAQYDSRMVADLDPEPAKQIQATPGANSNAASVAVLMELARTLDVPATTHTICLAFFDAESNGGISGWQEHLGSLYFVQSLDSHLARCRSPRFVVILDQIGSIDQRFYVAPEGATHLAAAIWQTGAELGFGGWFINEIGQPSGNALTAFLQAQIPATVIIGGDYPYRHTLADTLDKLSAQSMERIGHTLKSWLEKGAPF